MFFYYQTRKLSIHFWRIKENDQSYEQQTIQLQTVKSNIDRNDGDIVVVK